MFLFPLYVQVKEIRSEDATLPFPYLSAFAVECFPAYLVQRIHRSLPPTKNVSPTGLRQVTVSATSSNRPSGQDPDLTREAENESLRRGVGP